MGRDRKKQIIRKSARTSNVLAIFISPYADIIRPYNFMEHISPITKEGKKKRVDVLRQQEANVQEALKLIQKKEKAIKKNSNLSSRLIGAGTSSHQTEKKELFAHADKLLQESSDRVLEEAREKKESDARILKEAKELEENRKYLESSVRDLETRLRNARASFTADIYAKDGKAANDLTNALKQYASELREFAVAAGLPVPGILDQEIAFAYAEPKRIEVPAEQKEPKEKKTPTPKQEAPTKKETEASKEEETAKRLEETRERIENEPPRNPDKSEAGAPRAKKGNKGAEAMDANRSRIMDALAATVPEFASLSDGQQLLVIKGMEQKMLARVEQEGRDKFSAEHKQGKFFAKIWKSVRKHGITARHTKETLKEYQSGTGEKLTQLASVQGRELVEQMARLKAEGYIAKDGKTILTDFSGARNMESVRPILRESADAFNAAANNLPPAEWGMPEATKEQRKKYAQAQEKYNEAKKNLANAWEDTGTYMGAESPKAFAVERTLEAHYGAQALSFLSEHPDAAKRLANIERHSATRQALTDAAAERGGLALTGFLARKATLHIGRFFGYAAAPIIGAAVGYKRGEGRAQEKVRELAKDNRNGKYQEGKMSFQMNDIEHHIKRLQERGERLIGSASAIEQQQILSQLKNRVAFIEKKLELGQIQFGKEANRFTRQMDLFEALQKAQAAIAVKENDTEILKAWKAAGNDIGEQIEADNERGQRLMGLKGRDVVSARNAMVRMEALKSAAYGALFAGLSSGYRLYEYTKHVGWPHYSLFDHAGKSAAGTEASAPEAPQGTIAHVSPEAILPKAPHGIDLLRQFHGVSTEDQIKHLYDVEKLQHAALGAQPRSSHGVELIRQFEKDVTASNEKVRQILEADRLHPLPGATAPAAAGMPNIFGPAEKAIDEAQRSLQEKYAHVLGALQHAKEAVAQHPPAPAQVPDNGFESAAHAIGAQGHEIGKNFQHLYDVIKNGHEAAGRQGAGSVIGHESLAHTTVSSRGIGATIQEFRNTEAFKALPADQQKFFEGNVYKVAEKMHAFDPKTGQGISVGEGSEFGISKNGEAYIIDTNHGNATTVFGRIGKNASFESNPNVHHSTLEVGKSGRLHDTAHSGSRKFGDRAIPNASKKTQSAAEAAPQDPGTSVASPDGVDQYKFSAADEEMIKQHTAEQIERDLGKAFGTDQAIWNGVVKDKLMTEFMDPKIMNDPDLNPQLKVLHDRIVDLMQNAGETKYGNRTVGEELAYLNDRASREQVFEFKMREGAFAQQAADQALIHPNAPSAAPDVRANTEAWRYPEGTSERLEHKFDRQSGRLFRRDARRAFKSEDWLGNPTGGRGLNSSEWKLLSQLKAKDLLSLDFKKNSMALSDVDTLKMALNEQGTARKFLLTLMERKDYLQKIQELARSEKYARVSQDVPFDEYVRELYKEQSLEKYLGKHGQTIDAPLTKN